MNACSGTIFSGLSCMSFLNSCSENFFISLISSSFIFIFPAYSSGFEIERKKMYEARGHTKFRCFGESFIFDDFWVNCLKSDSFTKSKMDGIIRASGTSIEKYCELGMLHYYVIK